jgi:hypothetical protein
VLAQGDRWDAWLRGNAQQNLPHASLEQGYFFFDTPAFFSPAGYVHSDPLHAYVSENPADRFLRSSREAVDLVSSSITAPIVIIIGSAAGTETDEILEQIRFLHTFEAAIGHMGFAYYGPFQQTNYEGVLLVPSKNNPGLLPLNRVRPR